VDDRAGAELQHAEQAVLGAMLQSEQAIERVTDILASRDFREARHGTVYIAIVTRWAAGQPVDGALLTAHLAQTGDLQRIGGAPYLLECIQAVPTVANATHYARIVADAATGRRVAEAAAQLDHAARITDPGARGERIQAIVDDLSRTARAARIAPEPADELDTFLAGDDPEYDWLIPGLVERGDRVILTGQEGHGKSTLLRQVAIQAACGLHPFGGDDFPPLSVLYVDLENGVRHTRRQLRTLRLAAGDRYKPTPGLHVECRPGGLNLLDPDDGQWLLGLAKAQRADILLTGPVYKMAAGDPTLEETAKPVSAWLDRLRTEVGCALLLEAHTPYGSGGGRRPERPYGASLWSRWPEFGVFLAPDGALRHWRGQRDERDWPAALQRGGAWPWTPVTRPDELRWAKIKELCLDAGDQLSERDLAKLLGVGNGTIHRDIQKHRAEWDALANLQDTEGGAP
jgi:replicative DNA helicase